MIQSKELVVLSPRTKELERIIDRGQQTFEDVGFALLEMKSDKRYREYSVDPAYGQDVTFNKYCLIRWGFGQSQAGHLIRGARAVAEVKASESGTAVPLSQRQARELARAPEGERAEVMAEVTAEHEPAEITAAVIREHVEARKPAPAPVEVVQDAEVLPDGFFDARDAFIAAGAAWKRLGATSQEMYAAYQQAVQ